MKLYTCPDCGKKFQEGFVPDACTGCGCPSSAFVEYVMSESSLNQGNISPALESSNWFHAEHVVNSLAIVNLVFGIIACFGGVIAGVHMLTEGGYGMDIPGILCIIGGVLIFTLSLLFWAVLKLLVNISYRLTRLDIKYNPK